MQLQSTKGFPHRLAMEAQEGEVGIQHGLMIHPIAFLQQLAQNEGGERINIVADKALLEEAKDIAEKIIDKDPELSSPENSRLKNFLQQQKGKTMWSKIS